MKFHGAWNQLGPVVKLKNVLKMKGSASKHIFSSSHQ
jgi:hypothetical protein